MSRFILLIFGVLHTSISLVSSEPPRNLHTVLTPFRFSPVTKVETVNIIPRRSEIFTPSASAVAIAGPITRSVNSVPVVQKVESFTSSDSSNAEIRDLLRSLLSELRSSSSKSSQPLVSDSYGPPQRITVSDSYGPPQRITVSDSYGPPPPQRNTISDSYGAPPRNTISDYTAPSYPDSFDNSRRNNNDKPEKVVVETPSQYKEIVRTVYQPVYVPYQYSQPEVVVQQSLPVVSAVPTRINTGSSAVAISTIHSSPAYAIQQQQVSVPYVQNVQPLAAYASAGTATILEESSGYKKK